MKKIIVFLIISFFLTGCNAEVNLKVTADTVIESIKIFDLKDYVYVDNNLKNEINSNIRYFEHEYEYYNMTEFEKDGYVGKIYEYTHDINSWSDLTHIKSCYETLIVKKTYDTLTIQTNDEYRCGYMYNVNNIKVNIESDLKVIDSNADKVEGNIYSWTITNDNYTNEKIRIQYALSESENNKYENNIETKNNKIMIGILLLICVVILITILIIYEKVKKSND